MKYHIGFLSLLLATLGVFAYVAVGVRGQSLLLFRDGSEQTIGQFLESFRETHKPMTEINFTLLYGGNGQFQVLHPLLDMRRLSFAQPSQTCDGADLSENRAENRAESNGDKVEFTCQPMPVPFGIHDSKAQQKDAIRRNQDKMSVLEYFLNDSAPLPQDFIITPPFIDSSGSSYAYLLAHKGPKPFSSKSWVELHLSFFKVSELAEILSQYHITDPEFTAISRLSENEVEDVIRGASLVLTANFLLLKNQSRLAFSPLSYWVYDVRDLAVALKNSKYELIADAPGAQCLSREGNTCWTYSSRHALAYVHEYSILILALIAAVFLILLAFYLKHLHEKSEEQNRHRLALQVLSHEFRTPVSAMLLMIDQLGQHHRNFNVEDQDLITRISTEVFRLQRIIEISRTYLQAEGRKIPFKFIEIPSINDWIRDFVSDFMSASQHKVEYHLLDRDQSLLADPFWLRFVVSSLLQNAFAHGAEPVTLRLLRANGKLEITVTDQGECEFTSLQQMTQAFVKSSRSQGMGLGLNITQFIVREWGGELRFASYPTAFTLSFDDTGKRTV